MRQRFRRLWDRLPRSTRRGIVLVVGSILIVISGLIGWLPGPGGMVPFLLGIAVLATEFTWAERFRDYLIDSGSRLGKTVRRYPIVYGGLAAILVIGFWAVVYWVVYKTH